MIESLAVLLLCQLAGEALAHGTGLPLPGPVLGMAFLLALLLLRDAAPDLVPAPLRDGRVEGVANGLLGHLSLLFVPAGVGVVGALDVLGSHGAALALALLASTAIGLGVTALVFAALARGSAP